MSFSTGGQGTDGPWVQFAGNDSTDEFALAHKIYDQGHIVVLLTVDATAVTTVQTITTHYTVADVAANAHDATTPTITMLTPPATGETLTPYRIGTLIQGTTFATTAFWRSLPAELRLDLMVMDLQYLSLKVNRAALGSLASAAVTTTLEEILVAVGILPLSVLTQKAVLVADDLMLVGDSEASFASKKATLTNLVTYLATIFMQELADDLSPTLGGNLDADSNDITNAKTITFDEELDNGSSGAADTIDLGAAQKQFSTLTANCTYTFTAPDGPGHFLLRIVQGGSGSYTVTWPGTVKWDSGTAPTLSTAIASEDIISIYYNGTSYYCTAGTGFAVP